MALDAEPFAFVHPRHSYWHRVLTADSPCERIIPWEPVNIFLPCQIVIDLAD